MKEKINASAIPDAYLLCLNQDCPKAHWLPEAHRPSNKSVIKWDYGGSSVPNTKRTKPATAPISALPASRLMHSVSSGCWSRCPTGKCKKLPAGSWTISGAEHTIECAKANGLSRRTSKKAFWRYWNSAMSVIRASSMPISKHTTGSLWPVTYRCNCCAIPM